MIEHRTVGRGALERVGVGVVLAVGGAWALGRLTADRWLWSAFLFYIPSVVVAGLLAAVGLWSGVRRRRGARRLLLAAVAPLLVVLTLENRLLDGSRRPPAQPSPDAVRIVHWNVARGRMGLTRIGGALGADAADLYVLSEIRGRQLPQLMAAMNADDFDVRAFHRNALIGRGRLWEVWRRQTHDLPQLQLFLYHWEHDGRTDTILVVDLDSALTSARHPALLELLRWMESERPDFIIGDFNAPRRSLALRRLPSGYRHAYDEAGRGWSATWPEPLPLYAIDQSLVGPRWEALDYRLVPSWLSDHRRQVLVVRPRDQD